MTDDVRLPERRAEPPQAVEREPARDDEGVDLGGEPPLPEGQPGPVDDGLGAGSPAAAQDAGERVAPVTAGARLAPREADADGADEPVLVQVEDDPGAGLPRGGERPPAERGVEVVGVEHARPVRRTARPTSVGSSPPRSIPAAAPARPSSAESRSSSSASSPRCSRTSQRRFSTERSSPPSVR